jgi:glycerol transport system permease protein
MKPHRNAAWLLLLPALAIMAFVAVIPLLTVFNFALHDIFSLQNIHWIGLDWYEQIVASDRFRASFLRSLLFSAIVLSIQIPLGIAVALLLTGLGRSAIFVLMLVALPLVVPWNMIPIMWLNLIDARTGLIGPALDAAGFDYKFTALHTWALIVAMDTWHWLGLVVILAYAGLASIPSPYRQAAAIDGASAWAVFRHIELPRITRALAIVLLLRCVDSLMIYTEAFAINAGEPNDATRFLSLDLGEEIKGFSYGQAAARSGLYFLIVLTIVWAFVVATRENRNSR